jgi:conjugative transfer region protein TrbK
MDRSNLFHIAAIAVLIAIVATVLVVGHRHPAKPVVDTPISLPLKTNDLSAELRRCRALGPQDAEDPRCAAVWEENRRRFFGKPARPLSPPIAAAPAPSGDGP